MQSSDVGAQLLLELEKTPKMLGRLRHEWAPSCFIVSFKLETDTNILVHKVRSSDVALSPVTPHLRTGVIGPVLCCPS